DELAQLVAVRHGRPQIIVAHAIDLQTSRCEIARTQTLRQDRPQEESTSACGREISIEMVQNEQRAADVEQPLDQSSRWQEDAGSLVMLRFDDDAAGMDAR